MKAARRDEHWRGDLLCTPEGRCRSGEQARCGRLARMTRPCEVAERCCECSWRDFVALVPGGIQRFHDIAFRG